MDSNQQGGGGYPPPPWQPGQPPPQQGYYPPQPQPPQQGIYQPQGYGHPLGQPMTPPPRVRPVSTGLYMALWWFGVVGGGVMTGLAISDPHLTELAAVCWAPLLLGAIAFWVLIYKAWAAIQDGGAMTTPGKALGLLFIPLFNIYWVFVAVGSWGGEFNRFADRHRFQHRASAGLFIAHCVMMLIPGVNVLTVFTGAGVIAQFCRGINAVAAGPGPGLPPAVAYPR